MNRSLVLAIAILATVLATGLVLTVAAPAGAATSTGDGSWVWQNTTPVGEPIGDLRFTSISQGFALAPYARTVLRTTDGGTTWARAGSWGAKGGSKLAALWFVDTQNGWVVGSDLSRTLGKQYLIYRTSNGGANWTKQTMTAKRGLADVHFMDPMRGWAVGPGSIERTTDGGAHWVKQPTPITSEWTTIAMHDYHTAWVGSRSGKIIFTSDGGAHWGAQTSGVTGEIRKLVFPDNQNGFGQVDSATLIATTDGGANWHQHAMPAFGAVNTDFTGSLYGWVTGPNAEVARTTNGGTTWQDTSLTLPPFNLYAIDFMSSSYGWVAGGAGIMARTTNGGDTWTWLSHGVHGDIYGLDAATTSHVIAAGAWPALTSIDAGANWTASVMGQIPVMLYEASYPTPDYGWACGDDGGIYLTTDLGQNWLAKPSGTSSDLLGLEMLPDEIHGWAVGYGGTALRTTNGGSSWQPGTTDTTLTLRDVDSVDHLRGWATAFTYAPTDTFNSVLLKTTDGGVNWATARTANGQRYAAVAFTDPDHGWIAGGAYDARIWRTTNGGATWSATSVCHGKLNALSFASPLDGWAAGEGGLVVHTHDGGLTWWKERTGASIPFYDVAFQTNKTGWVGGQDGGILHTTTGGWRNDRLRPVTTAPSSETVAKGETATLRYKVTDRSDRLVAVTIRIDKLDGTTVKTLQLLKQRTGKTLSARFVCKLPKGKYRFTVLATDPAGNHATTLGANKLYVH